MFVVRLAPPAAPAPAALPLAAWPGQAWRFVWRAVQDHVADLHGIPRPHRR